MKILIVEDDPNLCILWQDVFEQAGHTHLAAQSASQARTALEQDGFDLVLLDYYLADGDAGDLTGALGETPTLVVTGAAQNANGALFSLSDAIAGVLYKPVDIEDLIEVSEHLAKGGKDMLPERRIALGLEVSPQPRASAAGN